ncbi:GspH/FimT family pseudopilin [Rhabdochromatium marinum]|uniref:GspH/FimT family pseudopilin n=1 Tax=Rhabdochromatium marinum TaxID=48729 RepID=UPI001902F6E4|nr:GspH/FimT family pseudopilin [Rhabdochromatium marinum]MBK1648728.1 hypothetical protein [Rhabdochromatium marinum]
MAFSNHQIGISLIELVITIAILVILLSIAAPNYRIYMANQRAQAVSYRLMADLRNARSEAINKNTDCSLKANASGWSAGWQIVDCGGNCTVDGTGCPAARTVNASIWSIVEDNNYSKITFQASGRVDPNTAADFSICPTDTSVQIDQRRLIVSGSSITLNRLSPCEG